MAHEGDAAVEHTAPHAPAEGRQSPAKSANQADYPKQHRTGQKASHGGKRKREEKNQGSTQKSDDKRDRWSRKRTRVDDPGASNWGVDKGITTEEIENESRRPKRKVAVMIGYAGTGYKGMQISKKEKTIEGDLFAAFIAANAISKANADDPRKSTFVRCARTDKGVHAAGNVVSLKLIIEDKDIVEKINAQLPDQIRVWGIIRTNGGFSCYKACSSRWYEYLMPSYCLIPPHPDSFLAKKLVDSAKAEGVYEQYLAGLEDVKDFWEDVDTNRVKPLLAKMDKKTREGVMARLNSPEDFLSGHVPNDSPTVLEPDQAGIQETDDGSAKLTTVDLAYKAVKNEIVAAKRAYRISPGRLARLQEGLDKYRGTHNFYNYTVQKSFNEKSARRHIKSFIVNPEPIQINDTQWLSLKVHGQSFMMHQIRKMVAMAVLCVRCNTTLDRIPESYADNRISIPKAPGVGLLLERPLFDAYNERVGGSLGKQPVDFSPWEDQITAFKHKHIYQRMWDVEEAEAPFHSFFNQIDHFNTEYFLWLTATGIPAAKVRLGPGDALPDLPGDADDDDVGDRDAEGGEG